MGLSIYPLVLLLKPLRCQKKGELIDLDIKDRITQLFRPQVQQNLSLSKIQGLEIHTEVKHNQTSITQTPGLTFKATLKLGFISFVIKNAN